MKNAYNEMSGNWIAIQPAQELRNDSERAKSGTADRERLRRNNTGKNYLAICESLSAALDLYIEIFRHLRAFGAYSSACSVMGTRWQGSTMTNEEEASFVRLVRFEDCERSKEGRTDQGLHRW